MIVPHEALRPGKLHTLIRRVDALSLRERVFLFASMALLGEALLDHEVMAPALQAQAGWNTSLQRESASLAALRAELAGYNTQASGATQDPAQVQLGALQQALAQARTQQVALLSATAGVTASEATRLDELLRLALAKHPGVTLMQLESDAPANPGTSASAPPASASQAEPAASLPGIPIALALQMGLIRTPAARAGSEVPRPGSTRLAVAGRFSDLQSLVQQLEAELPGLRWGTLSLDASGALPLLTLQLWLPGAQP
jgi:MSHA biogenesis protein MshJ